METKFVFQISASNALTPGGGRSIDATAIFTPSKKIRIRELYLFATKLFNAAGQISVPGLITLIGDFTNSEPQNTTGVAYANAQFVVGELNFGFAEGAGQYKVLQDNVYLSAGISYTFRVRVYSGSAVFSATDQVTFNAEIVYEVIED